MSGDSADHDADLCESQLVRCDICGFEGPIAVIAQGWGSWSCKANPECRWPLGPQQRVVRPMTRDELDALDGEADQDLNPVVDAEELRWLIDCARALLTAVRE